VFDASNCGRGLSPQPHLTQAVELNKDCVSQIVEMDCCTVNRRRFLMSLAATTLGGTLPLNGRAGGVAVTADDTLLERARDGIQRHRQSALIVCARSDNGHPLPQVPIEIRQLRHAFLWGGNLFGWAKPGDPETEAAYRTRFASLFNFATLDFYWSNYEPEPGQPRIARTESTLEWCQNHGMTCKGHPLVWANIADPPWLPPDAAGIRAASLGRVRDLVGRFRGAIELWDVVNEPSLLLWANTRLGEWAQNVGTHSFVSQHLHAAREANPEATLLVNEVLTAYPAYSLLDRLREDGKPLFDAVGLQSHMHRGAWPLDRMWNVCDRYGQLGVPLHFTEFTVLSGARVAESRWEKPTAESERAQAEHVARHYTVLFGHPSVAAVSWWDLSDRGAWQSAPAGLLRSDMSPKPAFDRLHELIRNQWWTATRGRTNDDGRFACRAFHGRHRVTARWPDGQESSQDVDCGRGQDCVVNLSWERRGP
jgi:endo-1,4-beta-xylanase